LIANIARNSSGHRDYTEKDLAWIEFLIRLKETGMPIAEIRKFAVLRIGGDTTVKERLALLQRHKARVKKGIERLQVNLEKLTNKVEFYKELEAAQKRT
jgi:DNA-binding transcriptional MerR regulator